jgi:multiple sugar transport system ATP-binding protein
VGTPSEVFDRPANVFVAGFIGSPPMNQLDAEVTSEAGRPVARLGDGLDIPVPPDIAARLSAGQKIVVGFRPESLAPKGHALHSEAGSVALTRPVVIAEPLGTETILFTDLAGREVQGKMLNPRPVRAGEVMDFTLDLSRLHLFDKASGRSLRA